MNRLKITFLSFCALISALPAQAGFKDMLIRTLPQIALGASATATMYSQVPGYLLVQKERALIEAKEYPRPLDPEKTAWASKVLIERGALRPDETQPIISSNFKNPDYWLNIHDTVIIMPKNSDAFEGDLATMLSHERGHGVLQHCKKAQKAALELTAYGWLSTAVPLSLYGLKRMPTTISNALIKSLIFYGASYYSGKYARAIGVPFKLRQFEREADQFSIDHALHPDELAKQARWFRNLHNKEQQKLDTWQKRLLSDPKQILFGTHPSNLERAETFEKAAAELRTKQQSNPS